MNKGENDMTRITFLEFIVRGIPEGLIFFLAAHAFSKNMINVKRYLLSSALFSIIVYLIRFLPINNGLFILNLFVLILLLVYVNRFYIIEAIKAAIIAMFVGFISEGINVYFVEYVLNKDLTEVFNHRNLKILYTSPSLLIFGCVAMVCYIRLSRRKELKIISYGESNK